MDLFDNHGVDAEQNEKDGVPVIPVLENSATLRLFLDLVSIRGSKMSFYSGTFLKQQRNMDIVGCELKSRQN